MTPFAFAADGPKDPKMLGVPGCGGCHPGGGGMEYDRDGKRYDQRQKAEPALATSLDGDYHKAQWDKTGVVEADCFVCHLPGYSFKERNRQLKKLNFKWAATAASGIGQVQGFVDEGQVPALSYNLRLFNQDGKVALDQSTTTPEKASGRCSTTKSKDIRRFRHRNAVLPARPSAFWMPTSARKTWTVTQP